MSGQGTATRRVAARRTPPPRVALVILAAAVLASPFSAQDAPLPDPEPFLRAARDNYVRSERSAERFGYTERRTELHTNPFGRLGTGEVRVYRVRPAPGGEAMLRTLVERDGQPMAAAPPERIPIRRRRAGRRSGTEDVVATLAFTVDRRERVDGRSAIVVRFAPRPEAAPATRQGRIAQSFTGSIWVDEAAREVMRVEGTASEDLTYGFGMVARIGKGAHAVVTRARVAPDTWLPTSLRVTGQGRALLFRRLTINHVVEWLDYEPVPAD